MASKQPSKTSDYYPPREHFTDVRHWQAHVETLKQLYAIRDLVQSHAQALAVATSDIRKIVNTPAPGGAMSTTIGGFVLRPGQAANGDTIRYDAASGSFKFGA